MVLGTGVYIDAPDVTPLPGGLLAVADVRDAPGPHALNGVTYLSEACGVADVVPGDNCQMLTLTITGIDADSAEFSFTGDPGGSYILSVDGVPDETQIVFGRNPSFTVDGLTDGQHAATLIVGGTSEWNLESFTWPIAPGESQVYAMGTKSETQIDVVSGDPFSVYRKTSCKDLSGDDTAWAERSLDLGSPHAVEVGFMRTTLAQPTTDLPVGNTPVPLARGIAILEGYAADVYGGIPTLHMSRSVAARALGDRGVLTADAEWTVTTKQGALVANGGGYSINLGPDGLTPPSGQAWIYVTGQVTIVRGPVGTHRVLDHTNNDQVVLAERTYVPAVDCFVAAVLVTLEEA